MTEYEFSDEHMKAVYVYREPVTLKSFREAHWDEWIKRHDERVKARDEQA